MNRIPGEETVVAASRQSAAITFPAIKANECGGLPTRRYASLFFHPVIRLSCHPDINVFSHWVAAVCAVLLPALGRDRLFQKRPLQMQLRGDPA